LRRYNFKCFWHTKRFLAFKIWPAHVIGDYLIWKVIKWHNNTGDKNPF
jgi:hypothetical protein